MRYLFSYFKLMALFAWLATSAQGVGIKAVNVSDLVYGEGIQGDSTAVVAAGGTETAFNASFTITGNNNATYTLTLPATLSLTTAAGGTIVVNTFTSGTASGVLQLSATGSQTLFVGGTRAALASNQGAGSYTGSFSISVKHTSGGGASSATATTTASVISYISITNVSDLDFGDAVLGDAAQTVAPGTVETATNGSFTITGQASRTFSIVLPSTITLATGDGIGATRQLTVDTFTSFPSGTGSLDVSGSALLLVGATRALVPSNQAAGIYTGTYSTVVAY